VNHERVREVQQLWAVALHYLAKSEGLKYERRKYKDLLAVFRKGSVPERDLVVLARSADLDSAAIRLASLDERLNGGLKVVRNHAYPRNVRGLSGSGTPGGMELRRTPAIVTLKPRTAAAVVARC